MEKIDALTGLRIFAALVVFGTHLPLSAQMPPAMATALSAGYFGVTLFFVLSGFVLTWTYARRGSLRGFTRARVARIAPLYFLALAVAALLSPSARDLPVHVWVLHLLALQTWSDDVFVTYSLNGPAWSIGVEAFLYACFPLVLWALVRLRTRHLLWVLLATATAMVALAAVLQASGANDLPTIDPWSAHRLLYRTPVTRLGDFVLGCGLALVVLRSPDLGARAAELVQPMCVVVLVGLMTNEHVLFSAASWDVAYALPSAALIWSLAVAPHAPIARFLAHPWIVQGGVISFAFYLFHESVLKVVAVDPTSMGSWATSSAVALAVTLAVSIAAHHLVELRAQRFIVSLRPRSRRRDTASAPS